ncbi:MAG: hypothetical protein VB064_04665 [Oscillospiraceae bacterium]|nr:hypothetical protein [Oscillospiraceae bacterium]
MKKNNIKTSATIATFCALLVCTLAGHALADVIWEPNDDFYRTHFDECEYVNRVYYSNGENGYMELFSEPGGSSLGFAENGKPFNVQFSYRLGDEVWGVTEYSESKGNLAPSGEGDAKSGWFKLSDAAQKFDYQSFDGEHSTDYVAYDGDYSEIKDMQNIVVWTFPNSGETNGTIDEIDENFSIDHIYSDVSGKSWGFVSYYYGMKSFWICLTAPNDASLPAKDIPVPEFYTPSPDSKPVPTGSDMTTVIIICVAAVILSTAVLFAALNRKKQESAEKK